MVGTSQSMTCSQASASYVFYRNRYFQIAFRFDLCIPFYRVPPPCRGRQSPVSSGGVAQATALVTAQVHGRALPLPGSSRVCAVASLRGCLAELDKIQLLTKIYFKINL